MDSKHFKTAKDQQIEEVKRYHPIVFSAFAFIIMALCPVQVHFAIWHLKKKITGVCVRTSG